MKLDDLEKILHQVQTRPRRAALMVIIIVIVGISTIYVTHYVEVKAETHARHRSIAPATIGDPGFNEDMQRAADGPTIRLRVQSVNRGQGKELLIPRAASLEYLSTVASEALGLETEADVGAFRPFRIRWVVIQRDALGAWRSLAREQQEEIYGLFNIQGSLVRSVNPHDSLEELGLQDGMMLHLAAVEDEDYAVAADVDTLPDDREK